MEGKIRSEGAALRRRFYFVFFALCLVLAGEVRAGAESFAIDEFGGVNLRPQKVDEHPQQDNWIGGLTTSVSEDNWPLLFNLPFFDAGRYAQGTAIEWRSIWWDVQWGYVSPVPLTLTRLEPMNMGDMRLVVVRHALTPEAKKTILSKKVVEKSWVHTRYRYEYGDGQTFEAVYSRLCPAFLFSATGDTLRLFADNWVDFQLSGRPDKEVGMGGWPRLTKKLLNYMKERDGEFQQPDELKNIMPWITYGAPIDYVSLCIRPTAFAFTGDGGLEVHGGNVNLPAKTMAEPWLLVWFGEGAPLFSHTLPGFFDSIGYRLGQMDCPFLLVLENRPRDISLDKTGLTLQYENSAGRVAMMPLRGMNFFESEETQQWRDAGKVPDEVVEMCRFWARRLMDYPLSVRQTLRTNADDGTVTIQNTFSYESLADNWGFQRRRTAPVAPMMGLAYSYNFGLEFSDEPVNLHHFTRFGNLMAVDGKDSYTVTLPDMGKYVSEAPEVRELRTDEEKRLASLLDKEMARMIDAGHLAPLVTFDFPYLFTTQHWLYPSELLYSCALVSDFLSSETRDRLKAYLAAEVEKFPPGTFNLRGAARALSHLSPADARRVCVGNANYMPEMFKKRPEVLYHLWWYASKFDDWDYVEKNWDLIDNIFRLQFDCMDWPTCFYAEFDCESPNVSYRRGIHDINAFIAGAIGYARMSKHLGKDAESSLAYALASEWLMTRFACCRFDQSMRDEGLIRRSAAARDISDQWWQENVVESVGLRQVFAIDQYGVMLDRRSPGGGPRFWGGASCRYRYLFPEVGRFLYDRNSEQEQRPLRSIVARPAWYVSGGQFEPPADVCYENFVAAAYLMPMPSDELISYLDVPDCIGDLYFFQKAAAALQTSPQTKWCNVFDVQAEF